MRQPLGRSVTPAPCRPGQTGAVGPRCASGESDTIATRMPNNTSAPALRMHMPPAGSAHRFPRSRVISENDIVEALDVAPDEIRPFVEIGVVQAVANAFEHKGRLLDVHLAIGTDRAALAAGDDG